MGVELRRRHGVRESAALSTVAIIPARAGSKGIPGKNLVKVCGEPLIVWSVRQALAAADIESVWVSSDGEEILAVTERAGARAIRRPVELSGDTASSESAWLHALDFIEGQGVNVRRIVGMQATSPIREASDLDAALRQFDREKLDSLLSVSEIQDFFVWERNDDGTFRPVNYDYRQRRRRQAIKPRYRENGSFYVFTPRLLREQGNRLGGHIGAYVMAAHKIFQIDSPDDIALCEAVMRGYGLDRA
jgi:N-acylneuraminate cytidylyltransferase